MSEVLPLFPLNTVLFPGIPLPLHVFEHRYRLLVGELVDGPPPRRFGVVAIRYGLEVGDEETPVLHEVGCVAELRRVTRHEDGRYDVVTLGGPRFRLGEVDDALPYLRASVTYLPEEAGPPVPLAPVAAAFAAYAEAAGGSAPALPADDPVLASYIVAASVRLDLPEKQSLLALPDAATRLRTELTMLRRETALIAAAPREARTEGPFSLN
ncbi:MAG TPA: LON peptidase substrate-binding domain-containing protein [Mycobacteriales bacterium]|nr:LON peptidase substrate-binding domain-containing protein [Mycobacteriales bacterium]